jgi:hypothetical protein
MAQAKTAGTSTSAAFRNPSLDLAIKEFTRANVFVDSFDSGIGPDVGYMKVVSLFLKSHCGPTGLKLPTSKQPIVVLGESKTC